MYRKAMEEEKAPAVYIMANRFRGAMYVGVISALYYRVCDHKNERFDGYTKEHGLKTLVWYEHHLTMEAAIHREKLLKKWHRPWKFRLIEEMNPDWLDLQDSIDTLGTLVEEEVTPRPSPG